jgi:3-hydroxyisobutyrate dehydrogenase-like beta-hydroxyacid dehydrogenase
VRLSEAALARGVDFLEAPVSGSTPQAEQGQLLVSLILQRALELSVAMPATAAAAQVAATEHAREAAARVDEDMSAVVRSMRLPALP